MSSLQNSFDQPNRYHPELTLPPPPLFPPPRPPPSRTTTTISPIVHISLPSYRPLPLPLPLPSTTGTPSTPRARTLTGPRRPAPLRFTRQKALVMEAVPSFTVPDTAAFGPMVPASARPTTTQPPNTASTSASIPRGDSSLYLSTPPLSEATSSPPLTSNHPSSVSDRSPRPRPESVQFGPRAARKSTRVSSSVFLEQQRDIQVASPDEFGVPNASYPVIAFSDAPQVCCNSVFTTYQTLHKGISNHPSFISVLPRGSAPASECAYLPNSKPPKSPYHDFEEKSDNFLRRDWHPHLQQFRIPPAPTPQTLVDVESP